MYFAQTWMVEPVITLGAASIYPLASKQNKSIRQIFEIVIFSGTVHLLAATLKSISVPCDDKPALWVLRTQNISPP